MLRGNTSGFVGCRSGTLAPPESKQPLTKSATLTYRYAPHRCIDSDVAISLRRLTAVHKNAIHPHSRGENLESNRDVGGYHSSRRCHMDTHALPTFRFPKKSRQTFKSHLTEEVSHETWPIAEKLTTDLPFVNRKTSAFT